ncbi:MAG: response regulator transcription factor [Chloroflexi bacterium]|nr:response regulator transcription factor [Chloroflexota bacterium]MBV9547075.1 response regulator transcription factor [Chloroflexota bacterium]MBV9898072.1 response regulator transcription factor [Chloroflexota bacterium]
MTDARSAQPSISRVLIADDRARARRALAAVLAVHPSIQVVGEAADGAEAVAEVNRLQPDAVVMDLLMPHLDGIAATVQIKNRWPLIRVVAHSLYLDSSEAALAAGADAFVPKGAPVHDLVAALVATPDRS